MMYVVFKNLEEEEEEQKLFIGIQMEDQVWSPAKTSLLWFWNNMIIVCTNYTSSMINLYSSLISDKHTSEYEMYKLYSAVFKL